jgi:hypothetical protein
MTRTADSSMTKNAAPTEAPTMMAVASNVPAASAVTGWQAADDALPEEGVVCKEGQGVQDVDALDKE